LNGLVFSRQEQFVGAGGKVKFVFAHSLPRYDQSLGLQLSVRDEDDYLNYLNLSVPEFASYFGDFKKKQASISSK
jgi:hypothetical protein